MASLTPPSIEMVLGPMFAGKSTELMRRASRYASIGVGCAIVTSTKDTRYTTDGAITSHTDQTLACSVNVSCLKGLGTNKAIQNASVILIDEGQFYDDLCEGVCELVEKYNKMVIVAALSGNYKQEPFSNVSKLEAKADVRHFVKALCKCGNDAPFSVRITDDQDEIKAGGPEMYQACCRSCLPKKKSA